MLRSAPRVLLGAVIVGALLAPILSSEAATTISRRMDAGGTADFTDGAGNVWASDGPYAVGAFGFLGGRPSRTRALIAGTNDDALYQTMRTDPSTFEYRFDIPNGTYSVGLKFAEIEASRFGVGRRVFNVSIEGQTVLSNFDIFAQAGADAAIDRTFVATLSDGSLNVVFSEVTGGVAVSAIEVVAGGAAPNFSFSAAPASATIASNGSVVYTATVAFLNGFTSTNVDLFVTGLPAGVTGVYAPDPLTHEGESQLTLTASRAAEGTFQITLGATSGVITRTQAVTLVVSRTPDFSVSVSPATQSVAAGGSSILQVTVTGVNGFRSLVSLSVTGLPSGATASFSPTSVPPPSTSTMTITTTGAVAPGQYGLTITGTSGSLVHTTSATLLVAAAGGAWGVSVVGSTGVGNNSAVVGPGRSDGISRVYVGTVNTGRVMEFSWNGASWTGPVDIGGSPSGLEIHNMTMGAGRNDGKTRIYACSLDGNLYELTWNGTGWTQTTVGTPSGACTHAVVGSGRSDGVNRVYATRGVTVWEYTWNGSAWSAVQIGSVSSGIVHGIALGAGRGGTQNHLYIASTAQGTFEATFSGGAWSMASMGDAGDVRNVSVGAGRNDGVMRVYAGTSQGQVREFTWTGTSWTNAALTASIGSVIVHAYVLAGRNDGVMRVYGSAGDGNAYEFTWAGSSWTMVKMGGGTSYMYGFAFGQRPGDARNHLYGAAFDGSVLEFTWG